MSASRSIRSLWLGVASLSSMALWPAIAHAEEEFPGALQEAAEMPCAPSCLLCHTVNPGTAGTFSKPLAQDLMKTGKLNLTAGDIPAFNEAFAVYKAANPDKAALLAQGVNPDTGEQLCEVTYGCGATIAPKPASNSPDKAATAAGVLALLGGVLLMRRRPR